MLTGLTAARVWHNIVSLDHSDEEDGVPARPTHQAAVSCPSNQPLKSK